MLNKFLQTLGAGSNHVQSDDGETTEDYLSNIQKAKSAKATGSEFTFTEKDVILYSKSIHHAKQDSNLPLLSHKPPLANIKQPLITQPLQISA